MTLGYSQELFQKPQDELMLPPAYYYAQLFKIDRFLIKIKIDQTLQKKQSDSETFFKNSNKRGN